MGEDYAASLNKLSITSDSFKERRRKAAAEKELQSSDQNHSTSATNSKASVLGNERPNEEVLNDEVTIERTGASLFASTLIPRQTHISPLPDLKDVVNSKATQLFTFKDPSPDDVIFRAQTGRPAP